MFCYRRRVAMPNVVQRSVRTLQRTKYLSTVKTNRLMLQHFAMCSRMNFLSVQQNVHLFVTGLYNVKCNATEKELIPDF